MQKLFAMFPRGAPGLALLVLRMFVGAVWITAAVTAESTLHGFPASVLAVCGFAVVVGFTTPIASVLAVLIELLALNTNHSQFELPSFAPSVIGLALALLGPGAYSIDARLFGRRLMEFGPGTNDEK